MRPPSLFVQYCDDIRRELDGRLSIMGLYPGRMVVKPDSKSKKVKVFVLALVEIPVSTPLEGMEINVLWKNKKVKTTVLPESMAAQVLKLAETAREDSRTVLNFVLEIDNLDVSSEGWLRTKATVNHEEIDGMPLLITDNKEARNSGQIRTNVTPK